MVSELSVLFPGGRKETWIGRVCTELSRVSFGERPFV